MMVKGNGRSSDGLNWSIVSSLPWWPEATLSKTLHCCPLKYINTLQVSFYTSGVDGD